MVNTLFEYAKLGTEEYQLVMSSIDLCSLVRDLATEHYTDFEEHNITLDIDIPDEIITVNGDKNEIRRAVSNLVMNVYKHNPSGIKAKISVAREKDKAVIIIADSGNEIPDDMDIFKPFVTENSARTIGHGTGRGLAITKRIVERHGEELYLNKKIKNYSKSFTAEIPIAAEK
ncbi:MAG: HAMP domain-containing histidine kinase [Oscillospiraceae bacterium]|nr:HAMP domain-containing histidine kinase [Oscillospiraceae bacterium]